MTDLPSMTTREFLHLAALTYERWPDAKLVKNAVGNLAVYVGDEWVAWLNLRTGEIEEVE